MDVNDREKMLSYEKAEMILA